MSLTEFCRVDQDTLRLRADVLIVAIAPDGKWLNAIHGLLDEYAGDAYSDKLRNGRSIESGQTIIVRLGRGCFCNFGYILFIKGDPDQSITEVILDGLTEAADAGFASAIVPFCVESEVAISAAIIAFLMCGQNDLNITMAFHREPRYTRRPAKTILRRRINLRHR